MGTVTTKSPSSRLKRLYPWVVMLFCALFLFYKYVLQVSPSIMADNLMRVFHLNGVGLGNLAATYFYSYMVTQVFVGPLMDKYSARWLSALAVFICALGAFMFGMGHTLSVELFARALVGVGAAFATVSYLKMAAVWFKPERYALVGGLLATAVMVGSMTGEAPLSLMFGAVGWRVGMYIVGVFGLVLALCFTLFVRDKNHLYETAPNVDHNESLKLKDFVGLLKKKENWLLLFYSGLAFSPLAVFGGLWGNPFLVQAFHVSKTAAATLTSMSFLGLGAGAPFLGYVSDKLQKRFAVMMFGLVLSFVALALVVYLPMSTWVAGVLLFLFGFGVGAFMLGFTVGKELNNVALAATVIGLINTGDALFGAFTEPMVGKFLDMFGDHKVVHGVQMFSLHDFHLAFAMMPVYLLLAAAFLWPLRKKC